MQLGAGAWPQLLSSRGNSAAPIIRVPTPPWKWEPRGKRRIHKKPNTVEINACRPWLDAEIRVIQPEVVVLLGATAAQGIVGRNFRLTQHRGEWLQSDIAAYVTATVHPSSILRAVDDESRHEEMRKFIEDLKKVAAKIHKRKAA